MKLETDHGTFEADTTAGVLKLERKAKREAAAKEKQATEDRKAAYERAYAAGYHVYSLRVPRGVRAYTPEDPHFGAGRLQVGAAPLGGDIMTYETSDGRVRMEHSGYRVLAVIRNGSGFDLAVVTQNVNRLEDPVGFLAIGIAGEAVAFATLEGLDWRVFRQKKEKE